MSSNMRFPTMWYVRPAKPQISLRICAAWSEPLLDAWIFYVMSRYCIISGKSTAPHRRWNTNLSTFCINQQIFSVMTLKIRSMSQNSDWLFIISSCCILANFVIIWLPDQAMLSMYQSSHTYICADTYAIGKHYKEHSYPTLLFYRGEMNISIYIAYFLFLLRT